MVEIAEIPKPTEKIDLHEHGFVRLVDWIGDELSIVNAARVSFHKESEWKLELTGNGAGGPGILNEKDAGLINFLLKNKHGTPFEQGFMAQFHCRVPIFVMREWIRHRIGFSYNEESGRYVEMRGDFFIPEEVRERVGKPGAYTYERIEDRGVEEWFKGILKYHAEKGYDLYQEALKYGIAPEQARTLLGLNLFTEFRFTCNARSLMNFLTLRNAPTAQQEIREYAEALEKIFSEAMPVTHSAFVTNGRVAP